MAQWTAFECNVGRFGFNFLYSAKTNSDIVYCHCLVVDVLALSTFLLLLTKSEDRKNTKNDLAQYLSVNTVMWIRFLFGKN